MHDKARMVFYPILLLLVVITENHPTKRHVQEPIVHSAAGSDLEALFRDFLSKLVYICCYEPGGSTVSACTALQLPSCVQYAFAFNEQTSRQLTRVQYGIKHILKRFGEPLPDNEADLAAHRKSILADVILFNRDRVRSYLRSLIGNVEKCIGTCERNSTAACKLNTLLTLESC